MKNLIAAGVIALFATPAAFAQTCTAPAGPAQANVPVNGTTCGADTTSFGSSFCGGSQTTLGAPAAVVAIDLGANNDFNVVVTTSTATFNPSLYFLGAGSCGAAASCIDSNDANGAGGNETVPSSGNFPVQAAGRYYAVVSSTASATDCGTFSLVAAPTLPVSLQTFSID